MQALRPHNAVLFSLSLVFFSFSSSVHAEEMLRGGNIHIGSLKVHPFFYWTGGYDDNVFRTPNAEREDFFTTFSPGIRLLLLPTPHRFFLEYRSNFTRYVDFSSENADDHRVMGKGELHFPGGASFTVEEVFIHGHDPRGLAQNVLLDFYDINRVALGAGYEVGAKTRVQTSYSNEYVNYREERNRFRDRIGHAGGIAFFYAFLPKTSALTEYNFTHVEFGASPAGDSSRDSNIQRVNAGITWEITTQSRGTVKAGYEGKDFEANERHDFSTLAVSIDLAHDMTAATTVTLHAERGTHESNLEGQNFLLTNGVSMTVSHDFPWGVTASLSGSYARDAYREDITIAGKTDTRRDDTWKIGTGAVYKIQEFLLTGAQYDYTRRNSSFDAFEYTDNTVFLTASLLF